MPDYKMSFISSVWWDRNEFI